VDQEREQESHLHDVGKQEKSNVIQICAPFGKKGRTALHVSSYLYVQELLWITLELLESTKENFS